jgi:hypothetical protein
VTVEVVALPPGWRNVYEKVQTAESRPWMREGDERTETSYSACPAVLLQEQRRSLWASARPQRLEPPYRTRAVFAAYDRTGLRAALEVSGYAGTLEPGTDTLPVSEAQPR